MCSKSIRIRYLDSQDLPYISMNSTFRLSVAKVRQIWNEADDNFSSNMAKLLIRTFRCRKVNARSVMKQLEPNQNNCPNSTSTFGTPNRCRNPKQARSIRLILQKQQLATPSHAANSKTRRGNWPDSNMAREIREWRTLVETVSRRKAVETLSATLRDPQGWDKNSQLGFIMHLRPVSSSMMNWSVHVWSFAQMTLFSRASSKKSHFSCHSLLVLWDKQEMSRWLCEISDASVGSNWDVPRIEY
jgi:hypothetical protein